MATGGMPDHSRRDGRAGIDWRAYSGSRVDGVIDGGMCRSRVFEGEMMPPVKINIGLTTRDEMPSIVAAAEAFAAAINRSLDLEYAVYCEPMQREIKFGEIKFNKIPRNVTHEDVGTGYDSGAVGHELAGRKTKPVVGTK